MIHTDQHNETHANHQPNKPSSPLSPCNVVSSDVKRFPKTENSSTGHIGMETDPQTVVRIEKEGRNVDGVDDKMVSTSSQKCQTEEKLENRMTPTDEKTRILEFLPLKSSVMQNEGNEIITVVPYSHKNTENSNLESDSDECNFIDLEADDVAREDKVVQFASASHIEYPDLMAINNIDPISDEIPNKTTVQMTNGEQREEGMKSAEEIQYNFSIFQSNILYSFFFIAVFIYLSGEVYLSSIRNGDCYLLYLPKLLPSLLATNLILWLDFNFGVHRQNLSETNTMSVPCLEDLFQDTTNSLFCLIILPFVLLR